MLDHIDVILLTIWVFCGESIKSSVGDVEYDTVATAYKALALKSTAVTVIMSWPGEQVWQPEMSVADSYFG